MSHFSRRNGAALLMSEEARQQAQAEGLTLRVAENKTGYFGVCLNKPGQHKPYTAQVSHGGKQVHLGSFVTAEEAALCVARSPEGQVAAERAAAAAAAAAPVPLTSEEARQQAQAEGLTLRVADNKTGYSGVSFEPRSHSKPHVARVKRGGKMVHLSSFATAEEAALCVARSPEGQAAAKKAAATAAAAPPLTGDDDGGDDNGEESEEETVEVLDAVEVLAASDEEEEEALTLEAEELTLAVDRKRARPRESTRLGEEEPRARSTRLVGADRRC